MTFETALNELPEGTGFDSFAHKTPEDLAWVCLHELDMHSEGECRIPLTLRKKYYAFCLKWGNDYIKEESKDAYEQGLTQKNFAY